MTNKEFESAIRAAFKEHIDEYIPESEIDYTPHNFSTEFEAKMQILIESIGKHKHISRKKMITCIVAAIIAACAATMSVSAVREAFINFITQIFETHTDVKSVEDNQAPNDFSDIYEITADISDFQFVSCMEYISNREYDYENENCHFVFNQYIKEYYDISVNTEGYEMEVIHIDDYEGYYIDMYNQKAKILTWDNGNYIFSLTVVYDRSNNIDKNRLLEIAKSVQKVE